MDFFTIALTIVAGVMIGLLFVNRTNADYSKIRKLKKEDFISNMRKGQLIDVRKKDLFEQDKIKGARLFRRAQLNAKSTKLRKDQSVYIYCTNGKKSYRGAKKLIKEGFNNVFVLEGGFEEYKK